MDTLTPSPYAKTHHQKVPTNLGGYQNISQGKPQEGDLLVWSDGFKRMVELVSAAEAAVRRQISKDGFMRFHKGGYPFAIYRKVAVPKPGDCDADVQAVIRSLGVEGSNGCCGGPPDSPVVTEAQRRKGIPVFSGFMAYFPDAIRAVAELSRIGNDQHNPGKPLHWDRSKSGDELDAMMRHLLDDLDGEPDTDGVLHATKAAWRSMANLQKKLEARRAAPTS